MNVLPESAMMFGLNAIVQHFICAHLSRNMQIRGLLHIPNYLPQKLNALLPPICSPKASPLPHNCSYCSKALGAQGATAHKEAQKE